MKVLLEDIEDMLATIRTAPPPRDLYFFTTGTCVPDDFAIEYFKDCGVIVMARDGSRWKCGRQLEEV